MKKIVKENLNFIFWLCIVLNAISIHISVKNESITAIFYMGMIDVIIILGYALFSSLEIAKELNLFRTSKIEKRIDDGNNKGLNELEQYRDRWLSERIEEEIGFYPREFYVLDNFSSFKLMYHGYLYSTAEEAYQASKFEESAPEIAEKIRNSLSAHEAQKIAYENKELQRKDWDAIKEKVMEEIIREKVRQHPYVRKKLIQTKNYKLVEDSPKDDYWGCGYNRNGQNRLGALWQKVRKDVLNGDF